MKTKTQLSDCNPKNIKTLPGYPSWEERVSKWCESMTLDERITWLESSWYVDGNGPDQFLFYLEVADRYGDVDLTDTLPGPIYWYRRTAVSGRDLSRYIRSKAFVVLAKHFFASKDGEPPKFPINLPYTDPLFSRLIAFFKAYNGRGAFDNLNPMNRDFLGKDGGKHYTEVANDFANDFAANAFMMLCGMNLFKYTAIGDMHDCRIALPHSRDIIELARRYRALGFVGFSGGTIPDSIIKLMFEILFEEANERGIVLTEKVRDISPHALCALHRSVSRNNDLGVFLNSEIHRRPEGIAIIDGLHKA